MSDTTARQPDTTLPHPPQPILYVWGSSFVNETTLRQPDTTLPHPPQPIRSVASPPRSSLARAREPAFGGLRGARHRK